MMNDDQSLALRVARFLPASRANGPGVRAVLWVQGCTLKCPGCFNPAMHALDGGEVWSVADTLARIMALADTIEGISVSGGEPLLQLASLMALLRTVRCETGLSTLLFTGYTWDELQQMPAVADVLACLDVVIAGRYDATQPQGYGMLGSANQTVHLLTERYTMADIAAVPASEVMITEDGDVVVSGVNPLQI